MFSRKYAADNSVADPEISERGGARNMKYKPPHVAAILFWPIFHRRGALDPLLQLVHWKKCPSLTGFHYTCYIPLNLFVQLLIL